jgi:hypothetical protein
MCLDVIGSRDCAALTIFNIINISLLTYFIIFKYGRPSSRQNILEYYIYSIFFFIHF